MIILLAALGCAREPNAPSDDASRSPVSHVLKKVDAEHLPNAYRLHEKVMSGGQPDGEAGFQELQAIGVKTVISVDGAKPDVALAKRYGMRYVHLPHGYDGVPDERAKELAKAVRDLPGPIYVHCHYGKHRSPAAATVACVATGLLQPEDALSVLRTAGTSEGYRGLYQSAEAAKKLDDAMLDALEVDFPETADLPPMAEAMVAIEHTHDHLKAIEQAKWKSPADHPDLEPAHEALLLRENFTELLRTDEAQNQPERFRELLRDSETAARELEDALRNGAVATDPRMIAETFGRITNNCKSCHQEFRDVPLTER